jgi:hypothetical protein
MKTKLSPVLTTLALVTTLAFSSCKKNYSCDCETKLTASGYSSTTTSKEAYSVKLKKKQATAACDNTAEILEKQVKDQNSGSGLNVSVECEVK